MSKTHTITTSWSNGSTPLQGASVNTSDGEINRSLTGADAVPGSTTNQAITIAFLLAGLKSIYLLSDQDVAIKTNSSGSPQETINLKAGQPIIWAQGLGLAPLFAGNITAMYVTNAGSVAANVNICVLIDSTP